MMLPRGFFVTCGVGMDIEFSNAFDLALKDAGIGESNLVKVSSILPANAVEVDRSQVTLTPGAITFCVMSRMDGNPGEIISAGIGCGWLEGEEGRDFGIICEHHGHYSREYLVEKVREKLYKMAEIRDKKLMENKFYLKLAEVKEGEFGSVVVALVFIF